MLKSVNALAPDVVGQFREPIGFKQTANGDDDVFDRRAHAVYSVDENGRSSRKLVQIGAEDGRVIEPSAFDVAINGSFAVADSPNGRERLQLFDAAGVRTGGFLLPGRGAASSRRPACHLPPVAASWSRRAAMSFSRASLVQSVVPTWTTFASRVHGAQVGRLNCFWP